jgi:hypothetical protein
MVTWVNRRGEVVRGLRFRSGNPLVASVDSAGRVAGRAMGSTVIAVDTSAGHGVVLVDVVPRQ